MWHKQEIDTPLFPDLLWSRPETKRGAGKLLIIGGNSHGFAAAAEAYAAAEQAGAGTVRVLLPDAIQKLVGGVFQQADFAPSTPSGSFARSSLAELLAAATWADGVMLAGDLGRNSETAVVLEQFVREFTGQLTITKDAVDYFKEAPKLLLERPDTTLVISLAQLQKLAVKANFPRPIKYEMALMQLVETLSELTATYAANIVVKHHLQMFVASGGQVSTTKLAEDLDIWRVKTAAHAAVWTMQNPGKIFEALTTSLVA